MSSKGVADMDDNDSNASSWTDPGMGTDDTINLLQELMLHEAQRSAGQQAQSYGHQGPQQTGQQAMQSYGEQPPQQMGQQAMQSYGQQQQTPMSDAFFQHHVQSPVSAHQVPQQYPQQTMQQPQHSPQQHQQTGPSQFVAHDQQQWNPNAFRLSNQQHRIQQGNEDMALGQGQGQGAPEHERMRVPYPDDQMRPPGQMPLPVFSLGHTEMNGMNQSGEHRTFPGQLVHRGAFSMPSGQYGGGFNWNAVGTLQNGQVHPVMAQVSNPIYGKFCAFLLHINQVSYE